MSGNDFDAIVVGSGITGGWAAKELTQRGLRVLLLERGPHVEHQVDYTSESTPPWDLPFRGFGDPQEFRRDYAVQSKGMHFTEWSKNHFVNDRENPYQSEGEHPFQWRRGYQLGGRSLTWGRQCYRWGDIDWGANARDGHGVDWPIRYADVAPWYDHVERFIGVSGSCEARSASRRHLPASDADECRRTRPQTGRRTAFPRPQGHHGAQRQHDAGQAR
jgi:choline dehydrogenase-like flavoprotein